MPIAEEQYATRPVIEQVCEQLGPRWWILEHDVTWRPGGRYILSDGRVSLTIQRDCCRWCVRVVVPDDAPTRNVDSITIGLAKSPRQIAADIGRRIMPGAVDLYRDAFERTQQRVSRELWMSSVCKRLQGLGMQYRGERDQYGNVTRDACVDLPHPDGPGAYGRITPSTHEGGSARVHLDSGPLECVYEFVEVLNRWKARQSEPGQLGNVGP